MARHASMARQMLFFYRDLDSHSIMVGSFCVRTIFDDASVVQLLDLTAL